MLVRRAQLRIHEPTPIYNGAAHTEVERHYFDGIVFRRGGGRYPLQSNIGFRWRSVGLAISSGRNMKRHWILRVSTVGLVSGILFGTVALG